MSRYTAEVLSPVHIGAGRTFTPEDNFSFGGGIVRRYNVDRLIASFPENRREDAGERLGSHGIAGIATLAEAELGLDVSKALLYASSVYGQPRQILEFFAAGHGRSPMFPGTSIKGAVKTALVWWMLKSNPDLLARAEQGLLRQGRPRRLEFTDECLNELLVGRDPNHDIGRLFSFGDSEELPWESLEVSSVVVEVPRRGGLQYKILPKGSTARLNEATIIHVESVRVETEFHGHFMIDTRLLTQRKLGWKDYQVAAIQQLPRACNEHALSLIQSRLAFWKTYRANGVAELYSELAEDVHGMLEDSDGSFVVPCGWGTGLQAKTIVSLFSPQTQANFGEFYGRRSGDRVHATCGGIVTVDPQDPNTWLCPNCLYGGLQTDVDVWAPAKSHKVVVQPDGTFYDELGWIRLQVEMPTFDQPVAVRPTTTPARQPQPASALKGQTGKVKFWNDQKGFGFITPEGGGPDVFVHISVLPKGMESITQGQKVSFEVRQGQKGHQATSITVLS